MSNCGLMEKLTSGRRFLVVMAGLAFMCVTVTICWVLKLAIATKDATLMALGVSLLGNVFLIITMTYKDYFARDRTGENGNGNGDGGVVPPAK